MFDRQHDVSTVTAVLPSSTASRVIDSVFSSASRTGLVWKARGTLLQDHWLKRWFPPIGPIKTMLQMIVPTKEVGGLIDHIVEEGRLHQQATGAVFSTPADHSYFGSEFHDWPGADDTAGENEHKLRENLSVIYAVVSPELSEKMSKAAIRSGAHGPIVYFAEGRGLRDRLGWLRITKQPSKEVLMVIADAGDVEDIFDAMASAGELHLPGRGFMYRMSIDKGVFNLPSRLSHHHYAANMQQIINAIDHLSGHSHWRDQAAFAVGTQGRAAGIKSIRAQESILNNQRCLTALVKRDDGKRLMDLMLNAGAMGMNVNYARFAASARGEDNQPRINDDYAVMRCVTTESIAASVCAAIQGEAEGLGISDLGVLVSQVPRVATYVPGKVEYRGEQRTLALSS